VSGAQHAQQVKARERFDADHFGAMIGEYFRANGGCAKPGEIQYTNTMQGLWCFCHSLASHVTVTRAEPLMTRHSNDGKFITAQS
jgi:hypothetical protein